LSECFKIALQRIEVNANRSELAGMRTHAHEHGARDCPGNQHYDSHKYRLFHPLTERQN
jgi:hypothetical protein